MQKLGCGYSLWVCCFLFLRMCGLVNNNRWIHRWIGKDFLAWFMSRASEFLYICAPLYTYPLRCALWHMCMCRTWACTTCALTAAHSTEYVLMWTGMQWVVWGSHHSTRVQFEAVCIVLRQSSIIIQSESRRGWGSDWATLWERLSAALSLQDRLRGAHEGVPPGNPKTLKP